MFVCSLNEAAAAAVAMVSPPSPGSLRGPPGNIKPSRKHMVPHTRQPSVKMADSVCLSVFLYLLHAKYQNIYSACKGIASKDCWKVKTFLEGLNWVRG